MTHDLGLAWNVADRIAVMYLGRIIEEGTTEDVPRRPDAPLHPGAALGTCRRSTDWTRSCWSANPRTRRGSRPGAGSIPGARCCSAGSRTRSPPGAAASPCPCSRPRPGTPRPASRRAEAVRRGAGAPGCRRAVCRSLRRPGSRRLSSRPGQSPGRGRPQHLPSGPPPR